MTESFRRALLPWALSRAFVIALAIVGSLWFGLPARGVDPAVPDWIALLGGWDTTWYLDVARNGYAYDLGQVGHTFTNLAFFPLLPAIMAAALALALNPFFVAIVVSNLALLVALALLDRLTATVRGAPSRLLLWVTAFFPTAAYSSLAYTDAVLLALALAAALAAVRGRWYVAGAVAAAASLTRPPGILVAFLLAAIALGTSDPLRRRARHALVGALPAVLALGGLLLWFQVARGSWSLPFTAQSAWFRGQPGTGVATHLPKLIAVAVSDVVHGRVTADWTVAPREIAFLALSIWLLVRVARMFGVRSPWFLYGFLVFAIPLSSGNLVSIARFGMMAFPLMWPLTDAIGDNPSRQRRALVAACVVTALLVGQLAIRSP